MKVKLSHQASMVNAHIATRLLDDPNFKQEINKLLERDYATAQVELCAYIRGQFNQIADVENISEELITAWSSPDSSDVTVKIKKLVRSSRSSALVVGCVLFAFAVFTVSYVVGMAIDGLMNIMLTSLM